MSCAKVHMRVVKQEGSPMIDFAFSELLNSLHETGYTTEVLPPRDVSELDQGVVIGVLNQVWLDDWLKREEIQIPELEAEGFTVRVKTKQRGRTLVIVGFDEKGAMYGGLDLAEQVYLNEDIDTIQEKTEKPFLRIRAVMFHMPLPSPYLGQQWKTESNKWFFDVGYWRAFLNMLARNRYNTLTLWCEHPFNYMVRVEKYPEATSLSENELEANIEFFKAVFAMAKERGIDTYIITWNIFVSEEFAKAHGIPPSGHDSFLVKDYMEECVKALLKTYPGLTGIGTCAGERMKSWRDPWGLRYNAQWIKDVYMNSIKESRRIVPFIFRAWNSDPKIAQEIIAADYPGQVYVSQKFNGEHMYSSPKQHHYKQEWLTQKPRSYELIWTLYSNDLETFRWGDPEFVRDALLNCKVTGAVGFKQRAIGEAVFGIDLMHSEAQSAHISWRYLFEKNWFREMLWGRLGYNPDIPEGIWIKYFVKRYGPEAGEDVYRATMISSRILTTVTSFHWNYMDGDWFPEFCVGGWSTERQYREYYRREPPDKFHSVIEWIFNHTIDETLLNIPQYVDKMLRGESLEGKTSPLELASRLEEYARQTLQHSEKAAEKISRGKQEFRCVHLDLKALAYLGNYYAEKIKGATELMFFLRTWDTNHQELATDHLRRAAEWWEKLIEVASGHYAKPRIFWYVFGWDKCREGVARDIDIPRQLGIVERSIR